MMQIATLLTPVLLTCLLLLWAAQPWLTRLAYWHGALAVNVLVAAVTLAIYYFGGELYRPPERDDAWFRRGALCAARRRYAASCCCISGWRTQALSRALHEARLQVLQARIRPHFLFNSINAVLSIVRAEPRQAETALEDMADLFRMAMADAQDLVPLRQEIELGRQYLALEQLRMGERLRVNWHIEDMPDDALMPPLMLQPLLENAVYHGIEPLPQGGASTSSCIAAARNCSSSV